MALWLSATLPPHFQRRQKLITKSKMGFFLILHSFIHFFVQRSSVELIPLYRPGPVTSVLCKINFNSPTLDFSEEEAVSFNRLIIRHFKQKLHSAK